MTRWDISQTRDLVRRLHGSEQLDRVRPCLQSVWDRQWYSSYHYYEAKRILSKFIDARLTDASLLEVVLGQDQGATQDFNRVLLEAGAHLVACVQSLHSLADILAHAVYYALAFDRTPMPIKERYISLASVTQRLQTEPSLEPLRSALANYGTAGTYVHLAALANVSKHRSIVRPALNEDFSGEVGAKHQLRIPAFVYGGKRFPEVAASSFIEEEYNRSSRAVVEVGNCLNALLLQHAP